MSHKSAWSSAIEAADAYALSVGRVAPDRWKDQSPEWKASLARSRDALGRAMKQFLEESALMVKIVKRNGDSWRYDREKDEVVVRNGQSEQRLDARAARAAAALEAPTRARGAFR